RWSNRLPAAVPAQEGEQTDDALKRSRQPQHCVVDAGVAQRGDEQQGERQEHEGDANCLTDKGLPHGMRAVQCHVTASSTRDTFDVGTLGRSPPFESIGQKICEKARSRCAATDSRPSGKLIHRKTEAPSQNSWEGASAHDDAEPASLWLSVSTS